MNYLEIVVILATIKHSLQLCFDPKPSINIIEPLKPGEHEFPLQQFLEVLGITPKIPWFGYQCKKQVQMIGADDCSCSKGCQTKGECCIDYLWHDLAFNNKSSIENSFSYSTTLMQAKPHQCLPFFPFDESIKEYYIMVAECSPDATNITDVDKCLNSQNNSRGNQIPVFGYNNDGNYLYKNRFCARCNQVYNYKYDGVELFCGEEPQNPDENIYKILKYNPDCSITPTQNKLSLINACEPFKCNPNDATLCRSFLATFDTRLHLTHRNVFCARCLYGNDIIGSGTVRPVCPKSGKRGWSKTINLKDFKEVPCHITEARNIEGVCQRKICGQLYKLNKLSGRCEKVLCPAGSFVNSDKECERNTCPMDREITKTDFKCELINCSAGYTKNSLTLECDFKLCQASFEINCFPSCNPEADPSCQMRKGVKEPTLSPRDLQVFQSLNCVKKLYQRYAKFAVFDMSRIHRENLTKKFINTMKHNWTIAYQNRTVLILKQIIFVKDLGGDLIAETKSNKLLQSIIITEDKDIYTEIYGFDLKMMYSPSSRKVCGDLQTVPLSFQDTCQNKINTLKANSNGSAERIHFEMTLINGKQSRFLYYCKQFHLHSSCHRAIIYPKNYQVNENKTLLIYKDSNMTVLQQAYQINEYLPTPGTLGFEICSQSKERGKSIMMTIYPWLSRVDLAEYYISLTGSIMSLVCYVMIIVIFAVIPILRNTGGLYVLVLVVLLLISDLVFILSTNITPKTGLCQWSAVFLYWALLTVCIWSCVVALDLTLKFIRAMDISAGSRQKMVLWRRLFFTMMASLISTIIMVCLNETGTYGINLVEDCWIGNFKMSLIFYFIPVIVGYLLCFGCLCLVLRSIKQKQNESDKVLGKRDHQDNMLVKIAIKLFLILGISEIFGLIQIRTSNISESELVMNAVFRIVYDIIRSLRGVFIFIVYIMNEKTLKLVKKSFDVDRNNEHELSRATIMSIST